MSDFEIMSLMLMIIGLGVSLLVHYLMSKLWYFSGGMQLPKLGMQFIIRRWVIKRLNK